MKERYFELGNERSAIRELFEFGKKRKEEVGEENVFDFSLGNPSVSPPKKVVETLLDLVNSKPQSELFSYQSAQGRLSFRKKIAENISENLGFSASENEIIVTLGAAAGLVGSLTAMVEQANKAEAEIVVIAPYFPEYSVFVRTAGAKLVSAKTKEDFSLDILEIEKKINKNTVAIIINSPNNPTGVVYGSEELLALAAMLEKRQREFSSPIYILSDEPYREIVFGRKSVPFVPTLYKNTIVCYSFSKSMSLPGERIGYIFISENVENSERIRLSALGAMRAFGYVSAPSLFQQVVENCIGETSNVEEYRENGELIYQMLAELGYQCIKPQGAFYLFVKALEKDAKAFSEKAKNENLLLVPSDSFGVEGWVRISYCVDRRVIENSKEAFARLRSSYK